MAIQRVFALSGVKDCGKTHTLNYLAQFLEPSGTRSSKINPLTNPLADDASYIFDNINGHKVGIGTCGDYGWVIDRYFQEFDAAGCDTVIVACRSRVGAYSVDALESQASSHNVIVDYTAIMWEMHSPHQIVVEQTIARRFQSRI